MFIRAYLRASTKEQDADRAEHVLDNFARERGMKIAARYTENESGAKLDRPELRRLLNDAHTGDVLLCEQIDRLSRLKKGEWETLRARLKAKSIRVVALDLPTSWLFVDQADEFTGRMFDALNSMMLDMLAAIARKDYDDRRRRQAEGIVKAKAEGKQLGRPANEERNATIQAMLKDGQSWSAVMRQTGAARGTVAKNAKALSVGV